MTLIWEHEPWWTEHMASKAAWWRVRRSEDDSTLLAYHLTEAHATADRWTKIKPGRYLTAHTTLTQKEVKFWAEWHVKGERPAPRLLSIRKSQSRIPQIAHITKEPLTDITLKIVRTAETIGTTANPDAMIFTSPSPPIKCTTNTSDPF